jgi:hypothetical protein
MRKKETTLRGYDAYKARLRAGENVKFRESGSSMVPKIYSRQECEYAPVTSPDQVSKGDIVWCKVKGNHYTHLVSAKRVEADGKSSFQISNNKGRVNGWIGIENIFAPVVAVEGRPI